jgi:hypothetical protein
MFTDYKPSADDLILLLAVSTKLDFPRVRSVAILKIESLPYELPLDAISRLLLAQTYDVRAWFNPCCENLAARHNGLTSEEALELGVEIAHYVWTLREYRFRTGALMNSLDNNGNLEFFDFPPTPVPPRNPTIVHWTPLLADPDEEKFKPAS